MLVKWFYKVLAGKTELCSVSWSYMVEGKTFSGCPLTHLHLCTYLYTLNKCNYTKRKCSVPARITQIRSYCCVDISIIVERS